MKQMRKISALIGVMALMAASLLASSTAASEIGTTLTVESSAVVCEDTKPNSIEILNNPASLTWSPVTPTSAAASYTSTSSNNTLNFYINTCHDGTRWNIYASVSDFSLDSDSHTIPSANNVQLRGHATASYTGITNGGYTSPILTEGVQSFMSTEWVNFTGEPYRISTGTVTNAPGVQTSGIGGYSQNLNLRLTNIPGDTPPGTYHANMKLTITFGEP